MLTNEYLRSNSLYCIDRPHALNEKKIHLDSAKHGNKVYENKKNNNASIVWIFLETKMVIVLDPLLSISPPSLSCACYSDKPIQKALFKVELK